MSISRSRCQHGFTLAEMLVVLVILGLVAGMLFQSLQTLALADVRIAGAGAREQREDLTRAWLADSIGGLFDMPAQPFEGDAQGWQGWSRMPLQSHSGHPDSIEWELAEYGGLVYRQGQRAAIRLPIAGQALRFAYVDDDGRLQATWPPPLGVQRTLPKAIVLLEGALDTGETRLIAGVVRSRLPYEIPYEPERD